MVSLLETSQTCWNSSVQDYGMVMTASASASIFMLLVVAIVMHKTFLSMFNHCFGGGSGKEYSTGASARQRRHGNGSAADKKRRRRKGHHGSKHQQHHSRIRTGSSSGGSSIPPCPRLPKVEEVSSDGAASDISSNGGGNDLIPNNTKTAIEANKQDDTSSPSIITQEEEVGSIMTSPSVLESVVSSDETEVKGRGSIPLVCTVDTMSDDISCGSMSVRSGPPPRQQQQQQPAWSRGSKKTGKSSDSPRGKKTSNNNLSRGQKQTKSATSKTATQSTLFTRSDFGKATRAPETITSSSTENRQGSSNKMGHAGPKQGREGKGRTGGNSQSSRAGRGGKGGRSQKVQKNIINTTRTPSPLPTSTAVSAATTPKSDGTVISAASTTDSLASNGNNVNRIPPVSPYSQSLFSCEVGNSGWSLPALPSSDQYRKPTLARTTLASPDSSNQANLPYRSPETPADRDCGLWNTGSFAFNNSAQSTPQRPLRAPPGLPTPAAILNTPIRSSNDDLYQPINTPLNNHNAAPAMIPITPSFGTPITSQNNSVPYSWSGMGGSNAATGSTGDMYSGKNGHHSSVKENPFAVESMNAKNDNDDADYRIEAELQELGGQMIGSVLDF